MTAVFHLFDVFKFLYLPSDTGFLISYSYNILHYTLKYVDVIVCEFKCQAYQIKFTPNMKYLLCNLCLPGCFCFHQIFRLIKTIYLLLNVNFHCRNQISKVRNNLKINIDFRSENKLLNAYL